MTAVLRAAESKSMSDLAYEATRANVEARDGGRDGSAVSNATEKKAKRGFFSLLGKKDKKLKAVSAFYRLCKVARCIGSWCMAVQCHTDCLWSDAKKYGLRFLTLSGDIDGFLC